MPPWRAPFTTLDFVAQYNSTLPILRFDPAAKAWISRFAKPLVFCFQLAPPSSERNTPELVATTHVLRAIELVWSKCPLRLCPVIPLHTFQSLPASVET